MAPDTRPAVTQHPTVPAVDTTVIPRRPSRSADGERWNGTRPAGSPSGAVGRAWPSAYLVARPEQGGLAHIDHLGVPRARSRRMRGRSAATYASRSATPTGRDWGVAPRRSPLRYRLPYLFEARSGSCRLELPARRPFAVVVVDRHAACCVAAVDQAARCAVRAGHALPAGRRPDTRRRRPASSRWMLVELWARAAASPLVVLGLARVTGRGSRRSARPAPPLVRELALRRRAARPRCSAVGTGGDRASVAGGDRRPPAAGLAAPRRRSPPGSGRADGHRVDAASGTGAAPVGRRRCSCSAGPVGARPGRRGPLGRRRTVVRAAPARRAGRRRCSAIPLARRWSSTGPTGAILATAVRARCWAGELVGDVLVANAPRPAGSREPHNGSGAATPGRHHPRCARLLPVQGRRRPGDLRRQGEVASQPAVATTSGTRTCRPAPRRWWRRPRPSSGSRSATTSRRSCSSTASSSSTGPASTSGWSTTRATRSSPSPSTTSGPGPMVMRGAKQQGRPLLRALRPRLRHPRDARPAAAHVPGADLLATTSSSATRSSAGRACCSTSRSARARASARSTRSATTSSSTSSSSSSTATPTRSSSGSRRTMREAADELEFERAARLPRPADQRPQGHRAPADGGRPQRGPRRDRHRRRRARGGGAGVLRAPGPGGRPQGLRARQGRGPRRPTSSSAASCSSLYAEPPPLGVPKQVLVPARARGDRRLLGAGSPSSGARRSTIRVPQRGDKRTLQETVTQNAKEEFTRHRLQAGQRPQQPGQGAQRAAGRSSACPRRRCASSATT